MGGQRPGEGRLGDAGDGHSEIQRALYGPAPGALLLSLVEDDVDEVVPGCGVLLGEDGSGDLDEERLEVAFVPRREDFTDLCRRC